MKKTIRSTLQTVKLGHLIAIIILLASTPLGYIPLGATRATTVHIPVIIGSILLGWKGGAVLGTVFALTSLINNTINPTLTSFVFTPFYSLGSASGNWLSLIVCFIPRILTGIIPYFVFNGIKKLPFRKENEKKRETFSLLISGISGSLTNTILVMGFIFLFFGERYAQANSIRLPDIYRFIGSVIGLHGIPEAIVAGFLTLLIGKALLIISKKSR